MFGARSRGLLLIAAASISMLSVANGATIGASGIHRDAVDEQSYPWSAVGKLFTEGSGECSGVLIARDKVLTAAHCLFNDRAGRYLAAETLHFLVGYHTGRYSAHARVSRYEVGAGFDPLRYQQTFRSDWAVLTLTQAIPAAIQPLRLRRELAPTGTKAVLVGYPQDRPLAMTADRDCELRDNVDAGRVLLHTCRGMKGYSGAPILVNAGGGKVQIAGIQIGSAQGNGMEKMIAVPAQTIWQPGREEIFDLPVVAVASNGKTPVAVASSSKTMVAVAVASDRKVAAICGGPDDSTGQVAVPLEAIYARLNFVEPEVASSILVPAYNPAMTAVT